MQFKRNFQTLVNFKKEMAKYAYLESSDIIPILNWVKTRQKKVKTISKIINLRTS